MSKYGSSSRWVKVGINQKSRYFSYIRFALCLIVFPCLLYFSIFIVFPLDSNDNILPFNLQINTILRKDKMSISNTSCIYKTKGKWPNITDIPYKCVLPSDYSYWSWTNDRHIAPYNDSIEFNFIINKINCLEPFVFQRWADGEYSLITGKIITQTQDNWIWNISNGEISEVGKMLDYILNDINKNSDRSIFDNFYFAFPCKKRRKDITNRLFRVIPNLNMKWFSYALLFCDYNYARWRSYIWNVLIHYNPLKYKIILMVNDMFINDKFDCKLSEWTYDIIYIPSDHITAYENNVSYWNQKYINLANYYSDDIYIFFISAGPMAEVITYLMWKTNNNNLYIDVGSSMDEIVKGSNNRPYSDPKSRKNNNRCTPNGRYGKSDRNKYICKIDCEN